MKKSPLRRMMMSLIALALPVGCVNQDSANRQHAVDDGPVAAIAAEIDPGLVDRGENLFNSKGCRACHTIGDGNITGPDLEGVTERRDYGWIAAMMLNPDSMLKTDPVAKQLLADYMTPMLSRDVTATEARAIYEYLRVDK